MRYFFTFMLLIFYITAYSQQVQDTVTNTTRGFRKYPAVALENGRLQLRNEPASFARKMIRGSVFIFVIEGMGFGGLALLDPKISGWASGSFDNYGSNMKRAFIAPPVFDKDKWYFNYIGHPYGGATYYNAVRSQNATILQSSLFNIGHTLLWEYVIESGLEQPSIQDLIVTPVTGILLGELIHRGTVAMSRNGFKWYEATAVLIINPMYMLNNGFKFARPGYVQN
jgi:hypothetical protein